MSSSHRISWNDSTGGRTYHTVYILCFLYSISVTVNPKRQIVAVYGAHTVFHPHIADVCNKLAATEPSNAATPYSIVSSVPRHALPHATCLKTSFRSARMTAADDLFESGPMSMTRTSFYRKGKECRLCTCNRAPSVSEQ